MNTPQSKHQLKQLKRAKIAKKLKRAKVIDLSRKHSLDDYPVEIPVMPLPKLAKGQGIGHAMLPKETYMSRRMREEVGSSDHEEDSINLSDYETEDETPLKQKWTQLLSAPSSQRSKTPVNIEESESEDDLEGTQLLDTQDEVGECYCQCHERN